MSKPIRLGKLSGELNISLSELGQYIEDLDLFDIEFTPNTKIEPWLVEYLKHRIRLKNDSEFQKTKFDYSISHAGVLGRIQDKIGTPKSVFKYFSVNENSVDSLKQKYLFHSHFKYFNDPFDCSLDLISFDKEKKKTKQKKFEKSTIDTFENIGVCSYTLNPNSILMWSHYANKHTGYCLEFRSNQNRDGINPLFVNYINDFKKASFYKERKNSLFHMLYSKSKEWEYEQELRTVINLLADTKIIDRKIPFIEDDLLAVYFGIECENKVSSMIMQIVMRQYSNNIKFYQGRKDSNSFTINWEEL